MVFVVVGVSTEGYRPGTGRGRWLGEGVQGRESESEPKGP